MKIAEKITDLIGGTPLLKIRTLSEESGAEIIGKIEYFNPLSSIKDRTAFAMINAAEKGGLLKKGSMIVEPTSGNTGIGLAFVSASRGYKLTITMPETMSEERIRLLKALGAEVVLTPGEMGMKGAIEKAEEIYKDNPDSFMPQQFKNPANPEIHKRTTAEEVWQDTDGKFDFFIAGVGTGGTITGCGKLFKERNPLIKIVAVEPEGSAVLSGEYHGSHRIQGIGAGFIPDIIDTEILDEIIKVKYDETKKMVMELAKTEGLLVGISSGAAVAATCKIAMRPENKGKVFIVMLPDCGERYISTDIFDKVKVNAENNIERLCY